MLKARLKNIIKFIVNILYIFLLSITILSCKSAVEPDNLQPGSRNYKWFADTIKVPFLTLTRIWGNSKNNVFAVGSGGSTSSLIWHFDGNCWSTDSIARPISPTGLYGIDNLVWLGNYNFYPGINSIWLYNYSNWIKYGDYKIPNNCDVMWINDFCGVSQNDIYAVGLAGNNSNTDTVKGIIMHFNNNQWSYVNLAPLKIQFTVIRRQNSTGLYFIEGIDEPKMDSYKILSFNGKELNTVYSGNNYAHLESLNDEVYVVIQRKIYKYSKSSLILWKDFSTTEYEGRTIGWSENNFFCITDEGIGHYNGTDIKTLYKPDIVCTAGIAVPGCIFFLFKDFKTGYNVIVRGELQ